jgi:hypothetical protein
MNTYPRACHAARSYIEDAAVRNEFETAIVQLRQRLANDPLSEEEDRFVNCLTEYPLLTPAQAAEASGFSGSMADTLVKRRRIQTALALHTAEVRLMRILQEVERIKKENENAAR